MRTNFKHSIKNVVRTFRYNKVPGRAFSTNRYRQSVQKRSFSVASFELETPRLTATTSTLNNFKYISQSNKSNQGHFDAVNTLWQDVQTAKDSNLVGKKYAAQASNSLLLASSTLSTTWLFGIAATIGTMASQSAQLIPVVLGSSVVLCGLTSTGLSLTAPRFHSKLFRGGLLLGSAASAGIILGTSLPTHASLDALALVASGSIGFALSGVISRLTSSVVSLKTWQSILWGVGSASACFVCLGWTLRTAGIETARAAGYSGALAVLALHSLYQSSALAIVLGNKQNWDTISLTARMIVLPFRSVLNLFRKDPEELGAK